MPTENPRLGALDRLTVSILTDIVLSLDDKWLDEFEELASDNIPAPSDDEDEDAAFERWDVEVERLQDKVMKRVAGALTHYAGGTGDNDRLVREMNRRLGKEEDEEKPPHTILVYTGQAPAAHLVRQL